MADELVVSLTLDDRNTICGLLDIEQIDGKDARLFAEKVGMENHHIDVIWNGRGASSSTPTESILSWWQRFNPTVARLKEIMLEMDRYDVVRILENACGNVIEDSVVNWYPPDFYYHPRKEIDEKIHNIEKGRLLIIHGPIGTGKYSSAVNYLENNGDKFSVQWCIDCSQDKDDIEEELMDLAEKFQIKSGISMKRLFQAIKIKAQNKVNMIFLLRNLDANKPRWLTELLRIRRDVYIMATSSNSNINTTFQGAQMVDVTKFKEGVEFLKENEQLKKQNSDDDLKELCNYYDWSAVGITSAKKYIGSTNMSVKTYLGLMSDKTNSASKSRLRKLGEQRIYMSVQTVLDEMKQKVWFKVVAAISLVGHDNIPEFLLRDFFSSLSTEEKILDLNDLITESPFLKLLKPIKNQNNIRLLSCQRYTQTVIAELVDEDEKLRNDLILSMATILMRYFNKDNRYISGSFVQEILFTHVEIFLKHFEKFQDIQDERILIAVARLSDIVSFSYTQQHQPLSKMVLRRNSERAENIINRMCGIVPDDFKVESSGQNSSTPSNFTCVAEKLFKKLKERSSKLAVSVVKELVFSRCIHKNDVHLFPLKVRSDLENAITLTKPVSQEILEKLVQNNAAYSVEEYVDLFLPELYVSIIYSFGRHYFYLNRQSIDDVQFYITRLKLAYCISKEISKSMREGEAIIHQYLSESNALLYLFVNQEDTTSKELKIKEATVYCEHLKHAIERYKDLSVTKTNFFELGILKKNDSDVFSWCVCQRQIISCYTKLLSLTSGEERRLYLDDCRKRCDELLDRLTQELHLRHLSKYFGIVGDFYLSTNDDSSLLQAWRVFCISAQDAMEKRIPGQVHVKAVLGMSMVLSRLGAKIFIAAKLSMHMQRHVCQSSKNLDEDAELAKNISKIDDQNNSSFVKHTFDIWRRKVLQKPDCREMVQKIEDTTIGLSSYQISRTTPTPDVHSRAPLFPAERMVFLAERIPREWKTVARHLGLIPEHSIQTIEINNPRNVFEQAYQMLFASWKDCNSKDHWFSYLATALAKSGRNGLAKDMESHNQ